MRMQYEHEAALGRRAYAVEDDGRMIREFKRPFAWTRAFVWDLWGRVWGER